MGRICFYTPCSSSSSSLFGSDSRVRLRFLLALWFMVVMIYCVWAAWRHLQVPLLLLFLLLASLTLHVHGQALHFLSLSFCCLCYSKTVKLITAYQAHSGLKHWPSASFTCDKLGSQLQKLFIINGYSKLLLIFRETAINNSFIVLKSAHYLVHLL